MGAEEWREVEGWPYEVSDRGRVRRAVPAQRTHVGRVLAQSKRDSGYCTVQLSRNNRQKRFYVHHLVATAFLGPPPGPVGRGRDEYQVNHLNGNQSHNWADNLEWTTHEENHVHATNTGLKARGESQPAAKLTPALVREIRSRADGGEVHRRIADDLGVSNSLVWGVARRRKWSHISEEAVS